MTIGRLYPSLLLLLLLTSGIRAGAQPGGHSSAEREYRPATLDEHSVPLQLDLELAYERKLRDYREDDLLRYSSLQLEEMRSKERRYPLTNLLLSLDLFRAYASYARERPLEAQAIHDKILTEAPKSSRIYAQAGLLSALQHFSHVPLRRDDVHAGLDRLEELSKLEAVSAEVQPELLFWTAEGNMALGLGEQADAAYTRALEKASDPALHALVAFRRGELNERRGSLNDAEKDFASVVEIQKSPLRMLASLRRSSVLRSLGSFRESLAEADRAEQLLGTSTRQIRTSARGFSYISPLVEEMLLVRTETDRIINSTPEAYQAERKADIPAQYQLVSPFVESEIALLRGSAMAEMGEYSRSADALNEGLSALLGTADTSRSNFVAEHRRFVRNALEFELGWSLFQQQRYNEAAKQFLALAERDTSSRNIIRRDATLSLREQGRFADPFFEEPKGKIVTAMLDSALLHHEIIDTSFFFYNDFPERSRFYAGVALARAGRVDDAKRTLTSLALDKSLVYSDRANYQLGLIEFAQKNFVQAELLLGPISQGRSLTSAYAAFLMGELTYRRNLYARAAAHFSNALAGLPDSNVAIRATAHLERGLSLIPLNAWAEAADDLSLYLTLSSGRQPGKTDEALYWLGRSFFRRGDLDSSQAAYLRVLREFPQSERAVDAQYGYAWTLFRQQEFTRSIDAFLKVLEMDSITRYSYDVLARAADAAYAGGDLDRANKLYNQAVDRPAFNDYRTTRALFQLGVTRIRMDSARSALNVYNYLTTRFPNSEILDRAYFNLAIAAFGINMTDRAEAAVEKLVANYPQSGMAPRGLLLAANERSRRGENTGALTFYRRLLDRYPTSTEVEQGLYAMQDLLLQMKRFPEAVAVADTFLRRYPEHYLVSNILLRKGQIQLLTGDAGRSVATLQQFIVTYPEHGELPRAQLLLGDAFLSSGDTAKAEQAFTTVIESYTGSDPAAQAHLELARISRKRGRTQEAVSRFQEAYDWSYYSTESAPVAMREHAQLLIASKQVDSAIAVLNELTRRYVIATSVGGRAQITRAQLLADRGNSTEAVQVLHEVSSYNSTGQTGALATILAGELLNDARNWRGALAEFSSAKSQYSLSPDLEVRRLFGVAEASVAIGRNADAASALKVLLKQRLTSRDRNRAENMLDRVAPKSKASPKAKPKTKPAKPNKKGAKKK